MGYVRKAVRLLIINHTCPMIPRLSIYWMVMWWWMQMQSAPCILFKQSLLISYSGVRSGNMSIFNWGLISRGNLKHECNWMLQRKTIDTRYVPLIHFSTVIIKHVVAISVCESYFWDKHHLQGMFQNVLPIFFFFNCFSLTVFIHSHGIIFFLK